MLTETVKIVYMAIWYRRIVENKKLQVRTLNIEKVS